MKHLIHLTLLPLIAVTTTAFIWGFRYIWFTVETILSERIEILAVMFFLSLILALPSFFIVYDEFEKRNKAN